MSDNQYLYKIQVTRPAMLTEGPTPEEAGYVSQHFDYLQKLAEEGVVLLAGRTQTDSYSSFGIILFVAASDEVAHEIVQNDPAVANKVMRAELYPFRIAVTGGFLHHEG